MFLSVSVVEGLLVYLCIYAIKYGAPSLIDVVDRVQAKSVFCLSFRLHFIYGAVQNILLALMCHIVH